MSDPLDVYVLFNATSDKPFIMSSSITGALGIFSNEDGAKRAKAESEGTDYKRVTYYKQHHIDALQVDNEALREKVEDLEGALEMFCEQSEFKEQVCGTMGHFKRSYEHAQRLRGKADEIERGVST